MGFSYDHFARGALTFFPETFSTFFFLIFIILMFNKKYFLSGIFCSLMVFIRPNYFPILFIYFLYNCYLFLKFNDYKKLFFTTLGLAFFLIIPLHNYVYGNGEFVLFTKSAYIPNNLKISFIEYFNFLNNDETKKEIINHLLNWITTGERDNLFPYIINTFLIINLLIFNLFMIKKFDQYIFLISFFALGQHSLLFFYNNTGRFAYFPWLLVLISNLLIFKNYYSLVYYKFFNKKYTIKLS